jgi:hypothetical protein
MRIYCRFSPDFPVKTGENAYVRSPLCAFIRDWHKRTPLIASGT